MVGNLGTLIHIISITIVVLNCIGTATLCCIAEITLQFHRGNSVGHYCFLLALDGDSERILCI